MIKIHYNRIITEKMIFLHWRNVVRVLSGLKEEKKRKEKKRKEKKRKEKKRKEKIFSIKKRR